MEELVLNVQTREVIGKRVKALRRRGIVPAILYGHGIESVPIQVEVGQLEEILPQAGSTQPIKLVIDSHEEPHTVLIKEVQRDVITRAILHVDFQPVVEVIGAEPVKRGEEEEKS